MPIAAMPFNEANLLPWPARLVGVALFAWVGASHLVHVGFMRGQPRAWHCTHLFMAAGMVYMFIPWPVPPVAFALWRDGYLLAAGLVALFVLGSWGRGRAVNLLWAVQLVGMLSMAYMFALMSGWDVPALRWLPLTLVGYYVIEASGWSRREFAEADDRRLSWLPFSIHPGGSAGRVCASNLCGRVPVDLAVSGTVMALGMSYMFLAMDPRAGRFFHLALSAGHPLASAVAVVGAGVTTLLVLPLPMGRAVPVP